MINKTKKFLGDNAIFILLLMIILFVSGCVAWKYMLNKTVNSLETINSIAKNNAGYSVRNEEAYEDGSFEYTDFGTIYHSPSGVDVGPFQYLYAYDLYYSRANIARYIGDNGLYGYLRKDGSLLTEPIFIEASEFQNGTAKVSQEYGKIYYIDETAKRISRDYCDGSIGFEMQGEFARVQMEDGTWGIINRKDELILYGAVSIEELPVGTGLGSAVFDENVVLFELDPLDEDEKIRIIAHYDTYSNISYVYHGMFAYVWTEDGLMGVVDGYGDVIVPAEYLNIEYAFVRNDFSMDNLIFIAKDKNGVTHVIKAKGDDIV